MTSYQRVMIFVRWVFGSATKQYGHANKSGVIRFSRRKRRLRGKSWCANAYSVVAWFCHRTAKSKRVRFVKKLEVVIIKVLSKKIKNKKNLLIATPHFHRVWCGNESRYPVWSFELKKKNTMIHQISTIEFSEAYGRARFTEIWLILMLMLICC
jgi:hypothetical protein